jgi:hypothetical protein
VCLLEVEPALGRLLSEEEHRLAERFSLPSVTAARGEDVGGLIDESGDFAALVLVGVLLQAVRIGDQTTLALFGPGGLVPVTRVSSPALMSGGRLVASARTRMALLGEEFLLAARRWTWLTGRLYGRMLEQSERLTAQLAVCQLPRVDERLLAVMWLLADSWGRVTPAGVRLDLELSHEALGGLIGARRPTVTIALKYLAERGALIRQDREWLILEPPPASAETAPDIPPVSLARRRHSPWSSPRGHQGDAEEFVVGFDRAARVRQTSALERQRAQHLREQTTGLSSRSRELADAIQIRSRQKADRSEEGSERTSDVKPSTRSRQNRSRASRGKRSRRRTAPLA